MFNLLYSPCNLMLTSLFHPVGASQSSAADEKPTSVPDTGAGGRLTSSFALVLVTVAAMFYLN